jgi:hypothetical protein
MRIICKVIGNSEVKSHLKDRDVDGRFNIEVNCENVACEALGWIRLDKYWECQAFVKTVMNKARVKFIHMGF